MAHPLLEMLSRGIDLYAHFGQNHDKCWTNTATPGPPTTRRRTAGRGQLRPPIDQWWVWLAAHPPGGMW